jgi:NAD(P)H-dependent flavin oxidoreductase YrpB (nitropropane dioxygenase family)
MNQVSDARLAIAVHEAGAFPSLSIPNYVRDGRFDLAGFRKELQAYKDATASDNLLLSVGSSLLLKDAVMRPFLDLGFRHVELFHWASTEPGWPAVLERSRRLAEAFGVRFVFKVSTGHVTKELDYPAIVLRGPEGAGRSAEDAPPLDEAFAFCRRQLPATKLIVSGGIATAAQVRDHLDRGAMAVAIGSLFAAARESSVSDEVKRKIVASTAADLRREGASHLQGLFTQVVDGDSRNLTRTLAAGVRHAGEGGIFMGRGIDQITEILPVREIVRRLAADLQQAPAASRSGAAGNEGSG